MDKTSIRSAVISMGYRKLRQSKAATYEAIFAKPVGACLLTVEIYLNRIVWTNWFKAADDGRMLVWESTAWSDDAAFSDPQDFLPWLKMHETYTKYDFATHSQFEFLSLEQQLDL